MSPASPAPNALELGAFEQELEGFAAAATSAEAALRFARLLALRLRDLPATGEAVHDDTGARWRAVREDDEAGRVELVCWRDADAPVLLRAIWQDGALELLRVHVGDRAWESRPGPGGDAIFDSDPTRDDAAARARADAFPQRLREERRRWDEATAVRRRRCPRCEWEAEEGETLCVICGAPLVAGASGAEAELPPPARADAPPVSPSSTNVLELPEAFARVLDELEAMAMRTGAQFDLPLPESTPTSPPRFEVVLQGFDRARRGDVIDAVRDVLVESGGKTGLDDPRALVERAPCVVRTFAWKADAEHAKQAIEEAGAVVLVRRRES